MEAGSGGAVLLCHKTTGSFDLDTIDLDTVKFVVEKLL